MNKTKHYICKCGKEFANSQSLNGHKARCRIVLGPQRYREAIRVSLVGLSRGRDSQKNARIKRKENEASLWSSSNHYCEKCGKFMVTKFGSGRFCSRSCANSRTFSNNTKMKTSNTLRDKYNSGELVCKGFTEESLSKAISTRMKNRHVGESVELVPEIKDVVGDRVPGWQPRSISYSYPEQFWKAVFDNNNVSYQHSVLVHNEFTGKKAANYELDFLIDGKYDVEIDGSQHNNEKIQEKGSRRDLYLQSLGYVVYRIKWVNPNTYENKIKVKDQIVDLFNFIGKELE